MDGPKPAAGLSPQVRGSPAIAHPAFIASGSIPAGAGEPHEEEIESARNEGLSPQVRGSRH